MLTTHNDSKVESIPTKNKIYWRCRRGLLELDLILIPFLEQSFDKLSAEQKQIFVSLLDETDNDLRLWLLALEQPENPHYQALIPLIKNAVGQ